MKEGSSGGRSESEKEKAKQRERQRRAVKAKIFHGLKKYGGYNLSPRADANELLRELAREAGWVIEPDGTTYRSSTEVSFKGNIIIGGGCGRSNSTGAGDSSATASPAWITEPNGTSYGVPQVLNCCPACGAMKASHGTNTPTPTSSLIMGIGGGGVGGDCSSAASPRHVLAAGDSVPNSISDEMSGGLNDIPNALYLYGQIPASGSRMIASTSANTTAAAGDHGGRGGGVAYDNTPAGSPVPRCR